MENLIVRALKNNPIALRGASHRRNASDLTSGWWSMFSGVTKGGITINHNTALTLSAVFNAVDQISNDIAKLPKSVYEKKGNSRFKRTDHPVHYLISKRPNRNLTQFNFHKALIVHAMLRGNGIAVINRDDYTGIQTGFDLIDPDDVRSIKKEAGQIYYDVKGYETLSSEDIIHIPGFSFNGIVGINIFRYAAKNLGAALSAETFADENFKSKGLLAGIITSDKSQVSVSAKQALANGMEARLSKGGTHNVGFLDEGMKFESIGVNAQEASLIDWKKTSVEDIARWFNIAPHKIKQLENATYSNIEQQSLEHGSDTIMPWAVRLEEEYDYKLFTIKERGTFYTKLNTDALIRTDIKTRGEYNYRAAGGPWITRNEVRSLDDSNPIDGLDEMLQPANTLTPDEIDKKLSDEKK